MKLLFTLLVSSMLFGFTTTPTTGSSYKKVSGTWKGNFGQGDDVQLAVVKFRRGNVVEFYEGAVTPANKALGSYEVLGDTSLLISYFRSDEQKQVHMQGNLNKTKNFVDGTWELDSARGSFFLQKQ